MAIPDEQFWASESADLADVLYRHMVEVATAAGVSGAAEIGVPVSIDWALVNVAVKEWAGTMSLDLVKGITETSRVFTTDAIAKWIESGQSLDNLSAALETMFGPVRAEMIASTEVTRAYAEGNRAAWKASGVVDGQKWYTARDELVCPTCGPLHGSTSPINDDFGGQGPPAHPRCRCFTQPVVTV